MEENLNTQDVISNRDRFSQRFQERHPDFDMGDEEAFYGQLDADYGEYEDNASKSRQREEGLVKVFNDNPYAAQFVADLVNNRDPWCGLLERIGIDGLTELINDPERREAFAQANAKFQEDAAKEEEFKRQTEENLAETADTFDQLESEGHSPEEVNAAADLLKSIANEVLLGKFTRQNMELAFHMLNRESEMAQAGYEGEVRGRNAKISESLRRPQPTDGVPAIGGANNQAYGSEEPYSLFRAAALAKK